MNINQLMKQATAMQEKMQKMQEEMANTEFEGKSGGGLVTVIMTGSGEMKKLHVDPSLLNKNEKDMLEDLVVAAHNDAKKKAESTSGERMGNAFGDLGGKLPAGMKFPF